MTQRAATIFNGTYTVSSPGGSHRTFRIKTNHPEANFAPGKRVIGLLVGPDNTRSYKNFGFVTDKGINIFTKMRGVPGNPSAHEWYAHMLWDLATREQQSRFYKLGYRLLLEGRCVVCNRKLTEPTSILTGIGPICAGRDGRHDEGPDDIDAEAEMEARNRY